MRPDGHETYIDRIDDHARIELVRNLLQDRHAELVSWRSQAIRGGTSGADLYQVMGRAHSDGMVLPWRSVLKIFTHDGEGWSEGGTDPSAWNYWKREWLVYQTGWIRELRGLVGPRCFGFGAIDEAAAWVAMEDLTGADQRPWSPRQFAACARHLGEFNGRFLTDADPPVEPWLSRGWVRGWTELADPIIRKLPSVANDPVVVALFPPSHVELLLRLWEHRRDFYQALDALRHSLAHNDLYPLNAFVDVTRPEQTVAIDWAACGWGPLGADLAPLIGASLHFFQADCDRADELEQLCLDAYMNGLRQTGSDIRLDDAYVGYLTTTVLRFTVGATGRVLGLALDPSQNVTLEQIFGRPIPSLIAKWRNINAFFEQRMAMLLHVFGYAS